MSPTAVTGGEHLAFWLAKSGVTHAWLAERLGVQRVIVTQWVGGFHRPGRALAQAIEAVTGISPLVWLDDDERESLRKAFALPDAVSGGEK